jgi:hypothetical protein
MLHQGVVVEEDERDAEIRRLRRSWRETQEELAKVRRDSTRALAELRRQLGPLYRALQGVFGELDAVGPSDAAPHLDSRRQAVWENWKSKLHGYPARIIDALLLHGEMNTSQLAIAVGCHKQRISEGISRLHKAGLINKNAGRFSLKEL